MVSLHTRIAGSKKSRSFCGLIVCPEREEFHLRPYALTYLSHSLTLEILFLLRAIGHGCNSI